WSNLGPSRLLRAVRGRSRSRPLDRHSRRNQRLSSDRGPRSGSDAGRTSHRLPSVRADGGDDFAERGGGGLSLPPAELSLSRGGNALGSLLGSPPRRREETVSVASEWRRATFGALRATVFRLDGSRRRKPPPNDRSFGRSAHSHEHRLSS